MIIVGISLLAKARGFETSFPFVRSLDLLNKRQFDKVAMIKSLSLC